MLTLSYADHWKYFTGRLTLSYEVKTSNAPNAFATAVSITDCVRNAVTESDVEFLADAEEVFHCWAQKLGSIVPKDGDRVTEGDGTRWAVIRTQPMDERQRYRLTVKKER